MQPNPHDPYGGHGQQRGPQYAPGGAYAVDPRTQLAAGVSEFMARVNLWMAAGVGVTGLVAWLVAQNEALLVGLLTGNLVWVLFLAPLVFVWIFASRVHKMSRPAAIAAFMAFSALMGVVISWIFVAYTMGSIASTFAVTAAMYGAMALFGYATKRDLSGMATFLWMALFGLIISGIVMAIMQAVGSPVSPIAWMIRAGIGVLVFAGFTAYDTQSIKQNYLTTGGAGNLAIAGALRLYLDFLNLFLFLLQLFGGSRD